MKFGLWVGLAVMLLSGAAEARGRYLGGGKHRGSHGGHYVGGRGGSSHKGGHYRNPSSGNKYGKHRP